MRRVRLTIPIVFARCLSCAVFPVFLFLSGIPGHTAPAVLALLEGCLAHRPELAEVVPGSPIFLASGAIVVPSAVVGEAVGVKAGLALGRVAGHTARDDLVGKYVW